MNAAQRPPAADWARVRALFEHVAELPGSEQAAALQAAGEATAVVDEVRALLMHLPSSTDDGFLAQPARLPERSRVGERLGAWRISARLGSGGMGEVWRAERDDGAFRGEAAVKVLRRGMDSAAVLARFAHEQQALARLTHPNIARLIDAGRTDDGLPYFVMERVRGRPLDVACRGLPLARRLALFLQLADAVAHAHRNLLVHRDLKPGNVLVDDEGRVKLLDFGIAKALDPLEAADGSQTLAGERPFTPYFASPEQVRGEPVSTATDIYSLGVLLYLLLTGERPYARSATRAAEAARAVLDEAPQRPSAVPGADARALRGDLDNVLLKALEKPVERRYASVDALAGDIRAWLGGYPVQARRAGAVYVLRKFVARNRWAVLAGALGGLGAATGLASALLQGRAAAALGVLGLAGGLGIALLQARQAAEARDDARRQLAGVKRVAGELVFRFGDTISLLPGGAAAQESMLKEIVQSLERTLDSAPDDPGLNVLLASALGRLAQLQGNPAFAAPERAGEAEATIARALALADRVWDAHQGEWRFAVQHLSTLMTRAQILRGRGEVAEGLQLLNRAAERGAQALARTTSEEGRAQLLDHSANIAVNQAHFHDHAGRPSLNRPRDALAYLDRAEADFHALYDNPALVAAMEATAPPGEPPTAFWGRHNIANVHAMRALVLQRLGDEAGMQREVEAALALRERNLAEQPRNTLWRQTVMFDSHTLAVALLRLGRHEAALAAVQRAWALAAELHRESGDDGPWAATQDSFAVTHARALALGGRPAEALPLFERGLASLAAQRRRADTGTVRQKEAAARVQRGECLLALGDAAAAMADAQAACPPLQALLDDATLGREASATLAAAEALLDQTKRSCSPR